MESFLQSAAWGEVQQAYGREVKHSQQGDRSVLAIKYSLPLKQWYWFIPQGPLVDGLDDGAVFVRYEPDVVPQHDRRVTDIHPSKTLITPLTLPDQMLSGMKQKCRYNIHIAEKKKLKVIDQVSTDVFFTVLMKTSSRQKIKLHPQRYYNTIIATLQKYDMVKVYGIEYQGQVIAVALIVYYQGIATYVHGGSDYEHRSSMAPYLLHWQIMQDAFQQGYQQYDWFGLSDRWPGVTRFKLGFGGDEVTRPGTFEHALRPLWYTGYRMMKTVWIS